jgi:hypothetical protein
MVGGLGADTLVGGAGNDTLTGSGGADVFVIQWTGDGDDLITDFNPAEDRIRYLGVPSGPSLLIWGSDYVEHGALLQSNREVTGSVKLDEVWLNPTTHASVVEGVGMDYGRTGHPAWFYDVKAPDGPVVTEGQAITFDIMRLGGGGPGGGPSPLTAYWTVTGRSWPNPADADDFGGYLSGRVDFAPDEVTKRVTIRALNDMVVEGDETLFIAVRFFGSSGFGGPTPGTEFTLRDGGTNTLFNSSDYLNAYYDVRVAGIDPLAHYMNYGWREGRDPGRAFDGDRYLAGHPDVAAAGLNPLAHYLSSGAREGREVHAAIDMGRQGGFDRLWYRDQNQDVERAGADPFLHFSTMGWREGRDPNALFDTKGYLAQNRDVAAVGIDPLWHYRTSGWREGRDPSREFDTRGYLEANPDVAGSGMDPLTHFLQFGMAEGRLPVADHAWG